MLNKKENVMKHKMFEVFGEPGGAREPLHNRQGEPMFAYVPSGLEQGQQGTQMPNGADEKLEVAVNAWLRENDGVKIISQFLEILPKPDGVYRTLFLSVFYE
jgi:hypothetical protein